jgi:hypothetical protein
LKFLIRVRRNRDLFVHKPAPPQSKHRPTLRAAVFAFAEVVAAVKAFALGYSVESSIVDRSEQARENEEQRGGDQKREEYRPGQHPEGNGCPERSGCQDKDANSALVASV